MYMVTRPGEENYRGRLYFQRGECNAVTRFDPPAAAKRAALLIRNIYAQKFKSRSNVWRYFWRSCDVNPMTSPSVTSAL